MSEITPIGSGELAAVADFLANFPGNKAPVEEWKRRLRAWWDLNPAFTEGVTDRGWVLRDEGKAIAGIVGNIPLLFQQDNRRTIVHAGTTWRVLPAHRGVGLTIKRRQMQAHREALHFSTTPAPQVVALLKLLGYQLIAQWQSGAGAQGHGEQSVIVLNFRTLLVAKLRRFPGAKLAAAVCAPWAALWQRWKLRGLGAVAAGGKVRALDYAGLEFDDLWTRTRGRYANTNVRSAAAIGWYCFTVPGGRKKLLGCYEGERLLGYLILLLEAEPQRLVARCVDLWTDPAGGDGVVASLLLFSKKWAADEGCDQLIFPHFAAELAASYARLGLPRRPAWERRAYVAGPKEVLAGLTPENSYFVEAQGDLGL